MNYQAHYDKLVARAQARIYSPDVYVERHHVIPRCMGGSDHPSNLVKLLPEEHLFAHRLLSRIHPHHSGLVLAIVMMTGLQGRAQTSKLYAAAKLRFSALSRGRTFTEAHRRNLSISYKGNSGQTTPKEVRQKISEAAKGRKFTDEHRENIRQANYTRVLSEDAAKRMRESMLGSTHSDEARRKIGESRKGKPLSEETRRRISEAHKARMKELTSTK